MESTHYSCCNDFWCLVLGWPHVELNNVTTLDSINKCFFIVAECHSILHSISNFCITTTVMRYIIKKWFWIKCLMNRGILVIWKKLVRRTKWFVLFAVFTNAYNFTIHKYFRSNVLLLHMRRTRDLIIDGLRRILIHNTYNEKCGKNFLLPSC